MNFSELDNSAFYIVTGGLGLLGKMHVESIAASGGIPVIIDIVDKGASEFCLYIKEKYNFNPLFFKGDITKQDFLKYVLSELNSFKDKYLLGLINNAAVNPKVSEDGIEEDNSLENFSLSRWEFECNVGLTGAFLCSKIFGGYMNEKGKGVILNIASDLALIAPDQRLYSKNENSNDKKSFKPVTYSVIKSGLIGLTRYLATYWPLTVRSNCLCPGGVFANQDPIFLEKVASRIPMARLAQPDEYKASISFLLSDSSSYYTGSIIAADGGRTCW